MQNEEVVEKDRRLRTLLEAKELKGILLKRQANFSWLTAGGINIVGIATEIGATSLLITKDSKYLLSNNIEAPRMLEEENLEALGYTPKTYNWWEENEAQAVRELLDGGALGCDVPFAGSENLASDVTRLRLSFTPPEIERYHALAAKAVLAVEKTMLEVRRGDKECEVVGRVSAELWKDRIDPITIMAAADDRFTRFRHPIPSERRIENHFMLTVNARKGGLIVCLTRTVHFGTLSEELRQRHEACVYVDCVMMANTIPGRPVRDVLQAGMQAYADTGFADEWRLHHQGGAIGYQAREYRATPTSTEVVQPNQPFCWNPTITGTKSEDTIMAGFNGPELVTKPVLFPSITVEANGMHFARSAILESA